MRWRPELLSGQRSQQPLTLHPHFHLRIITFVVAMARYGSLELRRLSLRSDTPSSRRLSLDARGRRRYSADHMQCGNGDTVAANGEVANSLHRRSSLTGDATDGDFLMELKTEALRPVTEDLCDWISRLLGASISADSFMETLDSGIILCQLAELIQKKAQEAGTDKKGPPPPCKANINYRSNARSGTWFARDNTANFIQWCKDYGIKTSCLFETEGLVLHKDSRSVILCLLELARLAGRYGLDTPSLINLEREIEAEEKSSTPSNKQDDSNESAPSQPPAQPRARSNSAKSDDLDKEVRRLSGVCKCSQEPYTVTRMSKGKYNICGKQVFIRLLRGKHAMVRVGGGWDTLEHYLITHDPCRIIEHQRQRAGQAHGKILVIQSKYKSS